ncbi:MAG: metallophosphoesterase family protein, partial [Bacteroidota bacterium]
IARQGVDHVVITGDISADAVPGDFESARQLLSSYGLLDSRKLSLIIGNHDIYGGVHHAEDILSFPRRCKQTDYEAKVQEFRNWFPEAFEKCMFNEGKVFPYAKVVGDIVFVGIDSNAHYSQLKNPLGSNGKVTDKDLQRVKGILSADMFRHKRRIVLIHHHFNKVKTVLPGTMHSVWGAIERETMKLRDKKSLLKLFRENDVALVLHGHHHVSSEYERKGLRFMNAGGSVVGPSTDNLSVNFISVTATRIDTEIHRIPVDASAISRLKPPLLHTSPLPSSINEHSAA